MWYLRGEVSYGVAGVVGCVVVAAAAAAERGAAAAPLRTYWFGLDASKQYDRSARTKNSQIRSLSRSRIGMRLLLSSDIMPRVQKACPCVTSSSANTSKFHEPKGSDSKK